MSIETGWADIRDIGNQIKNNHIPDDIQKKAEEGVAKFDSQWIKNLTELAPGIFITRNVLVNLKCAIDDLENTGRI